MDLIRIVNENHEFRRPENRVKQVGDLEVWLRSEAYAEYCSFVNIVNEAARGLSNKECGDGSDSVRALVALLDELDALVDLNPPTDQPQRFGNAAFRSWHQAMVEKSEELLPAIVSARATLELAAYLHDSFGNPIRIDYGTGHELAFVMFLLCCVKIRVLAESDKRAVVGSVFHRYMQLVRRLQRTYHMEPAGSHGVWSLDDYQFVPFIWGSSQLTGSAAAVKPAKMLDPDVLAEYGHDFLFLQCIEYIGTVKRGPFHEHSNQLWNISGLPDWSLVNTGLIKMYKDTVLNKFPIIQHVKFGSLIPFRVNRTETTRPQSRQKQQMPAPAPPLFHQTPGESTETPKLPLD